MVQKNKTKKEVSKKEKSVNSKKNKQRGWVEVSGAGEIHDFEKDGIELIGKYTAQKTVDIAGQGESQLYTINTVEDGVKQFWGSTILDTAMSRIKEGADIRLLFNGRGKKKGKKQAPKLFKVYVKQESDLIPF